MREVSLAGGDNQTGRVKNTNHSTARCQLHVRSPDVKLPRGPVVSLTPPTDPILCSSHHHPLQSLPTPRAPGRRAAHENCDAYLRNVL